MKNIEGLSPVGNLVVGLADTQEEINQAQKLRYASLVRDFDDSKSIDGTDASEYDNFCDHIIVKDLEQDKIIGTYRLMNKEHLQFTDKFICEDEFDITKLKDSEYNILELGRAVVDTEYRNGIPLKLLWQGVFNYVKAHNIRYLFGTASFHGVDPSIYNHGFMDLHLHYKASEDIMCYANTPSCPLNTMNIEEFSPEQAKSQIPSLIKGYLLLGSKIGEGAYIDYDFKSIDVMILMDMENVNKKYIQRMFGATI